MATRICEAQDVDELALDVEDWLAVGNGFSGPYANDCESETHDQTCISEHMMNHGIVYSLVPLDEPTDLLNVAFDNPWTIQSENY